MQTPTPAPQDRPQDPFSVLSATPGQPASSTGLSPLATVVPEALTALFEADPHTLPDAEFQALILEMRRRRSAFAAEEAAAATKPKKERTAPAREADGSPSPVQIANAALRDKPASEISLDDLGL